MPFLTIPNYATGDDIQVPATWEICDLCDGEGHHSQHLGEVSDWLAEQDEETCEAYARGAYDRLCEDCSGSGKVLVPNEEAMTPEQAEAWADECEYRAEQRHYAYLRERGIQY